MATASSRRPPGCAVFLAVAGFLLCVAASPEPVLTTESLHDSKDICLPREHVLLVFTLYFQKKGMEPQSAFNLNYFMAVAAQQRCDLHILLNVASEGKTAELFEAYMKASPLREKFFQENVHIHYYTNCGVDLCGVYEVTLSDYVKNLSERLRDRGVKLFYIFLNSTVRGPFLYLPALSALDGGWFLPFTALFLQNPKVALVGASWSCNLGMHSQSFAFAVNDIGLQLMQKYYGDGGIRGYNPRRKIDYVKKYEVGFSSFVLRSGYEMKTVMEPHFNYNASQVTNCNQRDPYRSGLGEYGVELWPSDTIFVKTGGYVDIHNFRSAASKARVQAHTIIQLQWAFSEYPLAQPIPEELYPTVFGVSLKPSLYSPHI